MILHIDTTDRDELVVQLLDENQHLVQERRETRGFNHAQHLLPVIDEILKNQEITLSDISELTVNPGPGSFTGTRVGVTVANALGYALNIPINGQKAGKVQPVYDRAPNISKPKNN